MIPRGGTAVRYPALPVASRQEEKERRKAERVAREEAERRAAGRRQRLQLVFGALLGIAVVAGVAIALTGVLSSGGSGSSDAKPSQPASQSSLPKLPQQQTGDLTAAAKAAGCTVQNPAIEGATHETKEFKPSDYKTNPPTSGNHNPDWYRDGIYAPGDVPRLGMLVHPLEHGRIEVQYKAGTPSGTESQLEAFMAEQSDGYHMLMFQNTTGMKYAVAATAWGHLLGCPTMNTKVFDALRTFRARYIDKGPEQVP
jgi:hypothetical protein